MFSNITSMTTAGTIVVLAILIGLIAYKFIKVKLLKKTSNTKIDALTEKVQLEVIKIVQANKDLQKIENEKGREAVVKYILLQIKIAIDNATFMGPTEKLLLKSIDLTVISKLIIDELITTGILTEKTDDPTKADNIINETLEKVSDIAEGGETAGKVVAEIASTVGDKIGITDEISDGIIEPIVEKVVEAVIPEPVTKPTRKRTAATKEKTNKK